MRLGLALGWGAAALAALAASCGSSDDAGLFDQTGGPVGAGDSGASGSSAGVFGCRWNRWLWRSEWFRGHRRIRRRKTRSDTGGFGGSAASGGSGGNCEQYCADSDHDGHGDPTKRPTACENLGSEWVTNCDDCHDQNPEVFPGTTDCRAVPYTLPDGLTTSFDYDCSGAVTECGEVMKAPASCTRTFSGCDGGGYLQSQPDGGGPSPYCGSTRYRVCNPLGPICTPATEMREAVKCL